MISTVSGTPTTCSTNQPVTTTTSSYKCLESITHLLSLLLIYVININKNVVTKLVVPKNYNGCETIRSGNCSLSTKSLALFFGERNWVWDCSCRPWYIRAEETRTSSSSGKIFYSFLTREINHVIIIILSITIVYFW